MGLGTIVSITEIFDKPIGKYETVEGYEVITTTHRVVFGVDNSPDYGSFGHLASNDDRTPFVGTELLSVDIVDDDLRKVDVPDFYEGMAAFVDLLTSIGALQFAVYDADGGGYYGSDALLIVTRLSDGVIEVDYAEYI